MFPATENVQIGETIVVLLRYELQHFVLLEEILFLINCSYGLKLFPSERGDCTPL